MKLFAESYQFHRQTESFGDFIRRERIAILVFGIGFSILLAAVILFIDPSFFYPRMQTDALLYYLKGKTFAESGSTAATSAINLLPFAYASMPGVLRSPMIRAFADFDDQLRAIQLTNIIILDVIALMSAYILSWVLPKERHWIAIGFAFGFSLITPWWMANVFLALADAPYAAFFLASMLVAIRILVSPKAVSAQLATVLTFVVLFVAAFSFRYTAPVLLVLGAALVKGRMAGEHVPRKMRVWGLAIALALVTVLILSSRHAIFGRYIFEPLLFVIFGEKGEILINLFCLAIPSQIIPGFDLGFSRSPYIGPYHAQFGATHGDIVWSLAGAVISIVVLLGVWRSRSRLMPEILMLLAVLPILALLMPSTARYLLTYQAFFWIWFYEGARSLSHRMPAAARKRIVPIAGIVITCVLVAGVSFGVSARRSTSGRANLSIVQTVGRIPDYFAGVTDTYRPLRTFLDGLPHDRTIIATSNVDVRWAVISGLKYYMVDSGFVSISRKKDVYIVSDCQSLDDCAHFDANEARMLDAMCRVGEFNHTLVFEARASRSRARVYRVKPA